MKIKMTLQHYLEERLNASSIPTHLTNINTIKNYLGAGKTKRARYSDILLYVGVLRKQYNKAATIQSQLNSIKHYYHWLIHTGQRKDHPCRYLHLKDIPKFYVQLQDLHKPEELEQLLHQKKYPHQLAQRTKVIISLLIYQALTRREILTMELNDINLEKATITVKGTTMTNTRTLPIKSTQIMLLHQYIQEERKEIVHRKRIPEEHPVQKLLLVTLKGTIGQVIIFTHLINYLRTIFPERKMTAYKIRQSVIANLLKEGKDIRIVQTFAGHKYPDTTERYRQTGIAALKTAIQHYHPIR